MKLAKTTLLLATLILAIPAFSMPILSKDRLNRELRKEKKRLAKEIQDYKKSKMEDESYKIRRGKFQSVSY